MNTDQDYLIQTTYIRKINEISFTDYCLNSTKNGGINTIKAYFTGYYSLLTAYNKINAYNNC